MSNLLATKLRRPPTSPKRVHRPQLIRRLNAGLDSGRQVTLVSAPPGFGKTTLLSDWAVQLQRPVAWVALDESDNDPIHFWSYVIAACQSIQVGIGKSALALLHSPQPLPADTIPTILNNDLAGLADNFVLILDDYHVIQNPAIHAALAFLIEHLSERLHLVLSTRVDPPWPLARLRARQKLSELRALDLRFSSEETTTFLNQQLDLSLSAEDVTALETRTEGWVAGLQLAALAIQAPFSLKERNDIASFIKSFAGSHVYVAEYLIEEVLQHQPAEVQTFLLKTSILDRLSAAVCEAVTECQAGQTILKQLHKANVFVIPLDDEGQWFRYHRLFADLLQARLRQTFSSEAVARLHSRASRWYEDAGLPDEAIQHAVTATDYAAAVHLIERHAVEMLMQGFTKTVESWLAAIPPEWHVHNPRVNLAFAWMHLLRGAYDSATSYVDRLQTTLVGPELNEADPALKAEWLALQAYLLSAQGRLIESLELAHQARDLAPETNGYVQSLACNALGSTYLMLNDYARVVEVYQKAIQHGRAAANSLVEMLGISVLAQIATQHGQLHFAYELAAQGIDRAERSGSPPAIVMAVHGALGQVHYQWAHFAEAQRHFLRAIQLCALSGYTAGEIYGRANLSRLLQTEGNLPASDREIGHAIDLMRSGAPAWGGDEAVAQQVSLHLAQHYLAEAESLLARHGFSFKDGFSFPDLTSGQAITYSIGLLYNSALRILLYRARTQHLLESLPSGIELADRLINGALQSQYLSSALEALLLRAQMHATLGNDQASLADVAQALERAEPEGFISIFVEAGSPIAEALAVLLKHDRTTSTQADYIKTILAVFSKQSAPQTIPLESDAKKPKSEILIEPLTLRELEVLQRLATGDSNQTIADKLVITVRTVKKHTSNIYGKLNVSNRTQAVARARELGLPVTD